MGMIEVVENKVYIAGPDVFEIDAIARGQRFSNHAAKRGLKGMYPLDNLIDLDDPEASLKIYQANLDLLNSADYVIANLNNFRGCEPDSGTVWEVAYAIGKGKPVIGYVYNEKTLLEKVQETQDVKLKDGMYFDNEGKIIENFGNKLNLMLEHSLTNIVIGSAEDALDYIANELIAQNSNSNPVKKMQKKF